MYKKSKNIFIFMRHTSLSSVRRLHLSVGYPGEPVTKLKV